MVAPVLFGLFMGESVASANVDLRIVFSSDAPIAPASIVLTASVSSAADPIISYRWDLDADPRCALSRCAIDVPVASCRRIAVEVTTFAGETKTATRALCAADQEGSPPSAEISIEPGGGPSAPLVIRPKNRAGSDPIAISRLWVDGTGPVTSASLQIAQDGACHAVDLLVADRRGRIGLDRRTVCMGDGGPRLWLGARPSACPPIGESVTLCAESSDPAGSTLERTFGQVPLDGCDAPMTAPTELTRVLLRAKDARGVESSGSVFLCSTVVGGPPRLMFASLPEALHGTEGQGLEAELDLFGGTPPFTIEAGLISPGGGTPLAATTDDGPTPDVRRVRIERLPGAPLEQRLEVSVLDTRGLRASARATVSITPQIPSDRDAGIGAEDSGTQVTPGVTQPGHGCSETGFPNRAASLAVLWIGSLLFLVSARRRKR